MKCIKSSGSYRVECCGRNQPAEVLRGETDEFNIWFVCDECQEETFLSEADFKKGGAR